MTVQVTDAHAHVHRLISVVKIATVLEEYTTEEQCSVVRFYGQKGLNAKDIRKEMFPVYGGKCLSRNAVHSWVEKRGKVFADDEEVEMELRKWLRQQSKDFYHMFYVLYPFVTYLLTLPRIYSGVELPPLH
jgi:hypothetical protein